LVHWTSLIWSDYTYNINQSGDKWIMNWKGRGRGCGLFKLLPLYEPTRKTTKRNEYSVYLPGFETWCLENETLLRTRPQCPAVRLQSHTSTRNLSERVLLRNTFCSQRKFHDSTSSYKTVRKANEIKTTSSQAYNGDVCEKIYRETGSSIRKVVTGSEVQVRTSPWKRHSTKCYTVVTNVSYVMNREWE